MADPYTTKIDELATALEKNDEIPGRLCFFVDQDYGSASVCFERKTDAYEEGNRTTATELGWVTLAPAGLLFDETDDGEDEDDVFPSDPSWEESVAWISAITKRPRLARWIRAAKAKNPRFECLAFGPNDQGPEMV